MLTIGLLIKPVAGMGGALAMKGSDDPTLRNVALAKGARGRGAARARRALQALGATAAAIRWLCWAGDMGETALAAQGIRAQAIGGSPSGQPTGSAETRAAALALCDAGDDLLLVATDRISTYDVVHPTLVPDKGRILTGLADSIEQGSTIAESLAQHPKVFTKM
jgi:predicted polyphosphate/ATP-dependent NAD kinase